MHICLSVVFVAVSLMRISAQQYGPVPPRPHQFPGATLVQPAQPNFRQRGAVFRPFPDVFQPVEHPQIGRSRRPQPLRKANTFIAPQQPILDHPRTNLIEEIPIQFSTPLPTTIPQFTKLTPRPVQEEVNEDESIRTTVPTTPVPTYAATVRTNYSPVPITVPATHTQLPSGFQRPQFLAPTVTQPPVSQGNTLLQIQEPSFQGRQYIGQPVRPAQPTQLPVSRTLQAVPPQIPLNSDRVPEEDYFRPAQGRPLKKQEPVAQQVIEKEPVRHQPPRQNAIVKQPSVRAQDYLRPLPRESHVKAPQKERKPVAQTIRKYHEEHEDGSITWGYENDDGSFKEETIGVDCVTRGKYGYFDPDGVKREYTYQTGIPCDKTQEAEEAESSHGYIDYTNNKYVLPNGDEIDLEAMVKNRARKPVPQYRV